MNNHYFRLYRFRFVVLVSALFLVMGLQGQNILSVPFTNGFVGTNTGNNTADNCYYTSGLGFTNLQFVQNSTSTVFVEQGNDIVGSVVFYDASGTYRSIPGFVKWRAPSGTVTTMVFRPSSATATIVSTNGSNGSSTYSLSSSNYIGLTFNSQTLSISPIPGSVSGNAATSGLLSALNTYLASFISASITDLSINEAAGTAEVTVSLSASSSSSISMSYATSNGTATSGTDYTASSGTLTFSAGVTAQTISIPITNDSGIESPETFEVLLSNPVNVSISNGSGTITIVDNDGGLSVSSSGGTEGCSDYVEFLISGAANTYLTLELQNGTATGGGQDFGSVSASNLQVYNGTSWVNYSSYVVIPATGYLMVRTPLIADATNESSESFQLKATPVSSTIASFPIYDVNFQTINLSGWSLLSGTDEQVNAVYRKTNAITIAGQAIDVRATITGRSNVGTSASNFVFDDDGSNASRFQPEINSTSSSGSYVDFSFKFYLSGTTTQVALENFYVTGVDVDGSSASATEFIELNGLSSYSVDDACMLTITPNFRPGFTRFYGIPSGLSNISFENTASFVANYFDPVSTLEMRAGYSSTVSSARLFSVAFGSSIGSFSTPAETLDNGIVTGSALITDRPTEICNNIDDDCDGGIDEGIATTNYYLDSDADGYGDSNVYSSCSNPGSDYVLVTGDCDDNNPSVYPGATEVCGNGVDDNCLGGDEICSIPGCTDPTACNYNASATDDNGSCTYPAQTYLNCDGTCINDIDNDGVCNETEVPGCTDPLACNYNASATDNNGSCTYPAQTYLNCDGTCINDTDSDGVCNEIEVPGCTDPVACNYNASATDEDASCTYPTQTYLNCDGNCINDTDNDGICNEIEVPGCTDPSACNYNASATDEDASCTYPTQTYLNCAGNCINDADNDGVCNEIEVPGCTDPLACNYNASATDENGTCTYPAQTYLNCAGNCINDTDNDGICNELEVPGCTDPLACNYNASATDNNGSCTYPAQTYLNCAGNCINDTDNDGVCDEIEVPGCTDPTACNYNASATDEDASCTYPTQTYLNCDGTCINDTDNDGVCNEIEVPGCTDPSACNYNASATDEDASCTYPTQTYLNCDGTCINDTDNDGVCNEIEVPGCTDPEACNYNELATDENESCTYPTLSYLDCEGQCINDADADGICNEEETSGCTDEAACNYNASSTDEDGSCVYASLTYYVDGDGDGFGAGDGALYCSDPGAGFTLDNTDCDDSNALISPSAAEVCNEVDDDCDIEVDEFVTTTFYADVDGDGFGNATDAIEACEMPDGYVDNQEDCDDNLLTYQDNDGDGMGTNVPDACGSISNEDCDDSNGQVFLGAEEICENGIDEDCDGQDLACPIQGCMDTLACNYNPLAVIDNESCTYPASSSVGCNGLCIEDTDGDGICNPDEVVGCTHEEACNYNPLATDEDDPSCIYPEAPYLNCDGTCINDVDSDGVCDELEVVGCQDETACNYNPLATDNATCEYASLTYYVDADGDGVGTDEPVLLCEVPTSGYADHPGDCDDNNASVYAGAVEICNDADDDCDGEIDEGVLLTFYADTDADGFGDNNTSIQGCVAPEGYVNNDSDCDDTQITYTDLDGDGYGSEGWVACGSYFNTDCDDSDSGINPLQTDICGNGIDEDCSGSDEVCPLIVAGDNTYSLNEDDANVVLDILGNDQGTATTILPSTLDLDVNTPGVQTTVTTSAGTWVSNGNGQVIFTPNPNYNSELFGDAILTYQVSDANGVVSNIATVTVEIAPIEDNPIIVEEMIDSITPFQTPIEICLDAQEVDDQDNFIINVFGPNNGTLTNLEDTNYCFTYTPNDNFSGNDSIAVIMCDSGSGSVCDTVWITINVGLGAPIAHNDFATIVEDEVATIDLLINDDAGDLVIDSSSVDLDPATPGVQQSYTSADGEWSVDNAGILTFVPNSDFNGIANITYVVSDTTGAVSNLALISVDVLPANDAPVITDEDESIVTETNFEDPIVVCLDVTDADGDNLILTSISDPSNGTLTQLEDTDLCFEYIPNPGFTGLDSVEFVVCDNGLPTFCDTVYVYINVLPSAPVANDDVASVDEDASVTIPILENDATNGAALDLNTIDLDVNTPTIESSISTAEGAWTVDGLGILTYTPVLNYNGIANLNYRVSDVAGNISNAGLITITVNPVNDAPNGPISVTESTQFETPATVCIDPTLVIDVDGDQVSVTSVLVDPANGVVSGLNDGDLCFTYVPNNNFTGTDSMLVTICDNGSPSLCDTVWAYVLIGGSAPIAQDDYVNSNTATVSIDVALNDQIPGNVGYTVSVVDSTSNGTIVLNGSLVSYTPDFGFCGVDSMLYSICNDMGMCDTAMLIIDVTPADADLDGISDFYETLEGDADADGTPNYLDEDSDNDGLTDTEEAGTSSLCDANFKDCDQDGTPDYLDFFTCGVALEIPEGFSPNGDNTNDTWIIPGVEEFPENTMTVFNRWGAQVYSKAPYDNSWDGTCTENAIGGNLLPEGTYFFVFKTGPNGETKNGYVYIKR